MAPWRGLNLRITLLISLCVLYIYIYIPLFHILPSVNITCTLLHNVPQPNPLRLSHFASIGLCLFSSLFLSMTYSKYSIFMGLWWIYLCNTMNFYNLFCNTMYLCIYIYVFSLYICLSLSLLCLCLCTFPCPRHGCHRQSRPCGIYLSISICLEMYRYFYNLFCHTMYLYLYTYIYIYIYMCICIWTLYMSLPLSLMSVSLHMNISM